MVVQYADNFDVAIFNGYSFRRDKKTGYYLASKCIDGKKKRLHVAVWEYHNGAVPAGYHVHHKLKDKSKNDIQDLELMESLSHCKLHGCMLTEEQREFRRRNIIEKATPKASEWHKSDSGRKWHSKMAKEAWSERIPITLFCTYCGNQYETLNRPAPHENTFCSNNCKSAYRRKMGFDNIDRDCATCGKSFKSNKYSSVKYCSAECRKNKTN